MTTVADKVLGQNEDEIEGRTKAFKTELNWGSIGEM